MSGRRPPRDTATTDTERIAAHDEGAVESLRLRAARARGLVLVVHHAEGTETAPLEAGAPIVVGRAAPATLCVPSAKLSRAHARFTRRADDRVEVCDLGSTNGTWVNGERVGTIEIGPGDEVLLGDTLICVQVAAEAGRPVVSVAQGATLDALDEPVAVAPVMRTLLETAARVAESKVSVILRGETGTGKEVLARFLHERGARAGKPLVSVNCAAIPAQLVESTLFGHERGAFTGAAQRQSGVFEEADGGTVFLDEIGELPLAAQAALLRVLETGRFSRLGSPRETAVDVRVVAATHRDLEALRDSGAFRADLYYRLSVMVLTIPALRERPEDIEALARRFVARCGGRVRDFSPAALHKLCTHAWPGNVRELRNIVERAVVLARGPVIDVADLPAWAPPAASERAPAPRARLGTLTDDAPRGLAGDLRNHLQEYQAKLLLDTLQATGWNQSEAARRLGMPIRTVSNRIKALGLKKPTG